jgi:hypothetical protein
MQVLRSLLNAAGAGAVLLLEDVDAAFAKREAGDKARHLTFSGARRSSGAVVLSPRALSIVECSSCYDGLTAELHLSPAKHSDGVASCNQDPGRSGGSFPHSALMPPWP